MAGLALRSRRGFLRIVGSQFVSRTLIPALIVGFWASMMTHLIARKIVPGYEQSQSTLVDPEILSVQFQPIEEWAWVTSHGSRVGATALIVGKRTEGKGIDSQTVGYSLSQKTEVSVALPGAVAIPVHAQIQINLSREFHIQEFAASVKGPEISMSCEGFVLSGRVYYRYMSRSGDSLRAKDDDAVYGFLEVGGKPLDLGEAVKPLLARHGSLRVGDRYSVRMFNPLGDFAPQQAEVVVAAEERLLVDGVPTQAFRLETTLGGLTRMSWVDTGGATLRRQLIFGYETERGGRALITQTYPALREDAPIPAIDRADFVRRAQHSASARPDQTQILGLLTPFLGAL